MNGIQTNNYELAMKYRPLLVLFPEISKGSTRDEYYNKDWRDRGERHIKQDYHPRDIKLVLDNAWLPGKKQKPNSNELLKTMSENKIDYINVTNYGVKECAKYWDLYAREAHKELYPRKAYAHVVSGEKIYKGYMSIQYWLPYFYDDWANVHQMDWEMVSVILKNEKPYACVFNAHHGGQRKYWSDVHKTKDDKQRYPDGEHPIVYVANGSHASYFSDARRIRFTIEAALSGGLQDIVRKTNFNKELLRDYIPSFESFEEEEKHFPEIEVIPEPDKWINEWGWLNFKGNWGAFPKKNIIIRSMKACLHFITLLINKNKGHLPVEQEGPKGPAAKGMCWENPFEWINEDCYGPEEFLPEIV